MADTAGAAAIIGATGVLVAALGHLNTRRQTRVSVATVEQQSEIERARLAADQTRAAIERAEADRRMRIDAYRTYLEVTYDFMAMAQGIEPLTRETWRSWRHRDAVASSALELVCSRQVWAAADRFDTACVAVCNHCLNGEVFDIKAFQKAYRISSDLLPAYETLITAMRAETAPG